MSPALKKFYRAYRDWLDAGAPDGKTFTRSQGLCGNVYFHTSDWDEYRRLVDELHEQFRDAGLNPSYPFGRRSYHARLVKGTQHLFQRRIDWVRKHAE